MYLRCFCQDSRELITKNVTTTFQQYLIWAETTKEHLFELITCLYFRASVDVYKKSCVQISLRNVADKLRFWERFAHNFFVWTLWSLHQSWHIRTSIHGIGGIRKGEIWQLTKRGWCRKAFVIKILY